MMVQRKYQKYNRDPMNDTGNMDAEMGDPYAAKRELGGHEEDNEKCDKC